MMLTIDGSRSAGACGRAWQVFLRTTACLFALSAAGCAGEPDPNFSQHPGFAEYFRDNPRAETRPDAAERALLRE